MTPPLAARTTRQFYSARRAVPVALLAALATIAHPVAARGGDTLRVWFGSSAPAPPYATWATACRDLQAAVDAADSGDVVLVKADTALAYSSNSYRCIRECDLESNIFLRGVLFPKSGVNVAGEEGGPLPILSGGDSIRTVLWVDGTRHTTIERLRLRDGGVLFDGVFDSTDVVRHCVIESCRQMEGAGMWIKNEAAPIIEGNLFESNATDTVNHHQNGGALSFLGSIPPRFPRIRGNVFRNNYAGRSGGAIRVKVASPIIEDNLFEGNWARSDGGAIIVQGGRPKINRNVFVANRAEGRGGAIATANEFGFRSMDIRGNVFERDSAAAGGALYLSHGGDHPAYLEAFDNTFVNCSASDPGTIVYIDGPRLATQNIYLNRNIFFDAAQPARARIWATDEGIGAAIDSFDCNVFWPALEGGATNGAGLEGTATRSVWASPLFVPDEKRFGVDGEKSPCAARSSPCGCSIGATLKWDGATPPGYQPRR
ncbi:MAG: right-handed parallel beta-helix repeat-containing protein [bacterium]